jgi:hypothetical protein
MPIPKKIPVARDIVYAVAARLHKGSKNRRDLLLAAKLMWRAPACKRAAIVRTPVITPGLRAKIRRLARLNFTIHEIANMTGLRNSGRVSEILNRKR